MKKEKMCTVVNKILTVVQRKFCNISHTSKISIVGGGPAGFYVAQQLVKLMPAATIDIYEKLPVPFGLVRYGVAPDHPEVKNVINTFTKTAKHPNVNFYGNVCLGKDFSLQDLKASYHAVILTYGAEKDRKLDIPGEGLRNVISARRFVGWYNGVPEDKTFEFDLNGEEVVIVGQGNVAVDVARILLSPIDKLKVTDITEYSLEKLCRSNVKKVTLVGRRGPLQVAFTIKELREMLNLPNVTTIFNKDDFLGVDQIIPTLGRPRKRLTELLYKAAMENRNSNEKVFEIMFKKSPLQFHGSDAVSGIELAQNILVGDDLENQKALQTNEKHVLSCQLALRSIGYKSVQAEPNLPFDERKGVAVNNNGRISPGLYCGGWLSTGPVGVILSTMTNAFGTAQLLHRDVSEKLIEMETSKPGSEYIINQIQRKGIQIVQFTDWEKIDREEQERGKSRGKPREKIVSIQEMLSVAS